MSKLDERIAAWRKEMTAAGIGAGPLRDELECHLRDGFDARVSSGLDPETAFTEAAARLGAPKNLRQEYDAAVSRWTRVKRFLGRRVELFPTDMRLCAWAAIPAGTSGIYFAILNLYVNRIFFTRETLAAGHYAGAVRLGLEYGLVAFISVMSFRAAILYLRRPAYGPARSLVLFWVSSAWFIGTFILQGMEALSRSDLSSKGRLIMNSLSMWPLVLTIAVALVSYYDWTKRLRGVSQKTAA
jgi:hypothetical protein